MGPRVSFIFVTKCAVGVWMCKRPEYVFPMVATLNTSISERDTNSSHMHNLAKSRSYQGLKLLLSDIKFMKIVNSMLTYHRFQKN